MRHIRTLSVVSLLVGLVPLPVAAQSATRALSLAGDLGFGALDGKAYTTVQTGIDVREGELRLELFGRVRLLIQERDEGEPVLRARDWDEAGDFVHILRRLSYRRTFDKVQVSARVGEMLGFTLGHGTLVRDYSNVADLDHLHSGLQLAVEHERFEVVAFLDNFIAPAVVATRVGVWPLRSLPGLNVGASLALDPTAPLQIRLDDEGGREVDSAWNLEAHRRVLALFGLDASYTFGGGERGSLMPYLDVNTSLLGMGGHAGVLARVPLGDTGLRLGAQAEYRVATAGYAGSYVDTFYDIERLQAGLAFADPAEASREERTPKQGVLANEGYGGHGALVQAALAYRELGRLKLGYTYRPGPDAHTLWARLSTQPIEALNIGFLLVARGMGGPHGGADGLAIMAEGRYQITDYLYGLAQYTRTWSLSEQTRYFGLLQAFNISIGANWDA